MQPRLCMELPGLDRIHMWGAIGISSEDFPNRNQFSVVTISGTTIYDHHR